MIVANNVTCIKVHVALCFYRDENFDGGWAVFVVVNFVIPLRLGLSAFVHAELTEIANFSRLLYAPNHFFAVHMGMRLTLTHIHTHTHACTHTQSLPYVMVVVLIVYFILSLTNFGLMFDLR